MQFSFKEWSRVYELVKYLGQTLRDSRPTYDDEMNYYAPKTNLSKDEQNDLESRINKLMIKSNKYLDITGMKPRKPLWKYERKNTQTHMSSPDFKYGHLIKEDTCHL